MWSTAKSSASCSSRELRKRKTTVFNSNSNSHLTILKTEIRVPFCRELKPLEDLRFLKQKLRPRVDPAAFPLGNGRSFPNSPSITSISHLLRGLIHATKHVRQEAATHQTIHTPDHTLWTATLPDATCRQKDELGRRGPQREGRAEHRRQRRSHTSAPLLLLLNMLHALPTVCGIS
jgi:hypothetical protein